MRLLNKLERKFGKYCIENLMLIVCIGQMMVYITDMMTENLISSMISLDWSMVTQGEIWRCVSFIFVPDSASLIGELFWCLIYFSYGKSIENEWGVFNFNCYYILGIICCNIAAAIVGFGVINFFNQTIFFAFALLYPDYKLYLYGLVQIKAKWIALVELLLFLTYLFYGAEYAVIIGFSLLPLAAFFFRNGVAAVKRGIFRLKNKIKNGSNFN